MFIISFFLLPCRDVPAGPFHAQVTERRSPNRQRAAILVTERCRYPWIPISMRTFSPPVTWCKTPNPKDFRRWNGRQMHRYLQNPSRTKTVGNSGPTYPSSGVISSTCPRHLRRVAAVRDIGVPTPISVNNATCGQQLARVGLHAPGDCRSGRRAEAAAGDGGEWGGESVNRHKPLPGSSGSRQQPHF